jgi:hypothetical protein
MNFQKHIGPIMLLAVFGLAGVLGIFSQADVTPINISPLKNFFIRAEPAEDLNTQLAALISEATTGSSGVLKTPIELDRVTKEAAMRAEQEAVERAEAEELAQQEEQARKAELARLAAAENKKKVTPPTPPVPPPAVSAPVVASIPASREIPAKSIVALVCHYTTKNAILTDAFAYRGELLASGTGVVIHPDGYILVARHIVDPLWTNRARGDKLKSPEKVLNENREFDYCEVGFIRNSTPPSRQEVVDFNYRAEVKNPFPYIATIFFKPNDIGMSNNEINSLDFAVLKIVRPWDECQYFSACELPKSYDYVPISTTMPALQRELLSYGFQDQSSYYFEDLVLQGAVGSLSEERNGSQYFAGQKLGFSWHVPRGLGTERIGSPVFWNGYLVGFNYEVDEEDQRKANAVGMMAVLTTLKNNGLTHIFSTQ